MALKEFQDMHLDKQIIVATGNNTVVSYMNLEGGMRSGPDRGFSVDMHRIAPT